MTTSLAFLAVLAADPQLRLGIFDLRLTGLPLELKTAAIDAMASAATPLPNSRIVTKNELEAMLGAEKIKDSVGCTDVACLAEIGAAAGVDRIIAGSVAQIDKRTSVSLQLINTRYGSVENRITLDWDGGAAQLTDLLGAATELLVFPVPMRKAGGVRLSGLPPSAVVTIDGKPTELGGEASLPVGVHELQISAKDYEPYTRPIIVRRGVVSALSPTLIERKSGPFYTQWWFWTPVAAVVAGGAATGIYFATRSGTSITAGAGGSVTLPPLPAGVAR